MRAEFQHPVSERGNHATQPAPQTACKIRIALFLKPDAALDLAKDDNAKIKLFFGLRQKP